MDNLNPQMQVINTVITPSMDALMSRADEYVRNSKAQNTVRAYQSDWQKFADWCDKQGLIPLPAQANTVAMYLTYMAAGERKASTISRHMISIGLAHKSKGFDSPIASAAVKAVWRGIRKTHGVAVSPKNPIMTEDLRRMIRHATPNLMGLRDRALLLIGFAGAFRRTEIVNINVENLTFTNEGLTIMLRRSKTDQDGLGRKIGIPYGSHIETCPVRTVQLWLKTARIESGPLFRRVYKTDRAGDNKLSDKTVVRIVKKYIEAIGLDPHMYAGHSLRAGLATSAAIAGAPERAIMAQTGHKSVIMVRRYIRDGNIFRENAAAFVGL